MSYTPVDGQWIGGAQPCPCPPDAPVTLSKEDLINRSLQSYLDSIIPHLPSNDDLDIAYALTTQSLVRAAYTAGVQAERTFWQ